MVRIWLAARKQSAAVSFRVALHDLWVSPGTISWTRRGNTGSFETEIAIEGTPAGAVCTFKIYYPDADGLVGTYEFVWKAQGKTVVVARLDLSGPTHVNASGEAVSTPHLQELDERGRMDAKSVADEALTFPDAGAAVRWLFARYGIQAVPAWQPPPRQGNMLP